MSLSGAMGVISVVFCVAVCGALYMNRKPPETRRLLVARDLGTGSVRALELLKTADLCSTVSTAPAWPELYGLRKGERFECRVPMTMR